MTQRQILETIKNNETYLVATKNANYFSLVGTLDNHLGTITSFQKQLILSKFKTEKKCKRLLLKFIDNRKFNGGKSFNGGKPKINYKEEEEVRDYIIRVPKSGIAELREKAKEMRKKAIK